MNPFPNIDPIPLPAPVALFKFLHILTLSLHFISVHLLLGGLLVGVFLNWRGHRNKNQVMVDASDSMVTALPMVMTYVINLGVPPLLFAQALYGVALYTSSILIGAFWLSVVGLLIVTYQLLYKASEKARENSPWWKFGLGTLLGALAISRIYNINMTLMLRPEVWRAMYEHNPHGTSLPPSDPTAIPRWLYMLAASFALSGVGMILLSRRKSYSRDAGLFLARYGGGIVAVGALLTLATGCWTSQVQPSQVQKHLEESLLHQGTGWFWLFATATMGLSGIWILIRKNPMGMAGITAVGLLGFSQVVSATIYRDGIRDFSLLSKGFDIWKRSVVVNWSVVIIFLIVFVLGLGAMAWLVSVAARAGKHFAHSNKTV